MFDLTTGAEVAKLFDTSPSQNELFTSSDGEGGLLRLGNRLIAANRNNNVAGVGNAGTVYVFSVIPEPQTICSVLIALTLLSAKRFRPLA